MLNYFTTATASTEMGRVERKNSNIGNIRIWFFVRFRFRDYISIVIT